MRLNLILYINKVHENKLKICFKDQQYITRILPDDISKCVPPDSISNSEVKPLSADGSVVRPCESRTLLGFYSKYPDLFKGGVFFYLGLFK